ncbi:MAG: hypothetical protein AAF613_04280 [Pseudomonadota bacterium]
MTDQPTPERDASGRFVKPPTPDAPVTPGDDDSVHPMSKTLFGWVDAPGTPTFLLALVVVSVIGLTIADFVIGRHDYFSFAEVDWFYVAWGFGGFSLAVLSGWPLGRLLRRSEDYYGEAETKPSDVEDGV